MITLIVSASYRTDIPTFYGKWFMNRLREGYCLTLNPYNRQPFRVSLSPADVDGFVFWTKNLGPFMSNLEEVRTRGFPFIVQYTISGYPKALEKAVVDADKSIAHMRALARDFGSRVGVWRYDTILLTSITDEGWHLRNFESLCSKLQGTTDEVVISFAQIYSKTKRSLDAAGREFGFSWLDPDDETKQRMVRSLAAISAASGMQLSICSQRQYLVPGVADARCVDADRLSDVAGRTVRAKLKGNRKDCGCYESKDIGAYDTCPHGCVYCYAVSSRRKALDHYRSHDPHDALLGPPGSEEMAVSGESGSTDRSSQQGTLFD